MFQVIEKLKQKVDAKLGIATFFPAGAPLSARIYKICTLLSTAFVENPRSAAARGPRKALTGAGLRTALGNVAASAA
jgi:hypothetical protein